jgi:hypothetical protein
MVYFYTKKVYFGGPWNGNFVNISRTFGNLVYFYLGSINMYVMAIWYIFGNIFFLVLVFCAKENLETLYLVK